MLSNLLTHFTFFLGFVRTCGLGSCISFFTQSRVLGEYDVVLYGLNNDLGDDLLFVFSYFSFGVRTFNFSGVTMKVPAAEQIFSTGLLSTAGDNLLKQYIFITDINVTNQIN